MADYVTSANTFIVNSFIEPTAWPADPQRRLTTSYHRIDWESLSEQFAASYAVAKEDPDRYREMSTEAVATQRRYSADTPVAQRLALHLQAVAAQGCRHDRPAYLPALLPRDRPEHHGRAGAGQLQLLLRTQALHAAAGGARDVRPLPELGQLDAAVAEVRSAGGEPVLMLFAPPHETVLDPPCPVVPVFAWEFDTIPDEEFGGDSRSNWAQVLSGAGMAITHSEFAVASVRRSLGEDFPIWSLPAPSWDGFAAIEGRTGPGIR